MKTNKKSLKRLAKELEFTNEYEYFDYMVESYYNGNFSQCRNLFNDMKRIDQKTFISYMTLQKVDDKIIIFYLNAL